MAFLTSSSWTRVTFCSFPSPGAVSLEMAGISTRLGFHSQAQKKAIHLFKFVTFQWLIFPMVLAIATQILRVQRRVREDFLFLFPLQTLDCTGEKLEAFGYCE